jgi:hypothetical protein
LEPHHPYCPLSGFRFSSPSDWFRKDDVRWELEQRLRLRTQILLIVASRSNLTDYEKLIGKLEGNAFEEEVCARLQTIFVDFQTIPAKPHGDGGLDGLSHGQERAYCCYGPEQEARKLENKGLKDDIVDKFSGDLRKLFELEFENKKLKHALNEELVTILGADRKIKHVHLIVSWFESHRVIGPLTTNFDRYKTASQLQFVEADATLTVWGPRNLAALGAVDEHTLFRIQNPALIASVQTASAAQLVKDSGGEFDAKFDDLKRRRPGAAANIDGIAQKLREAWAAAIALDNDLSKNSLGLHQVLESVRSDAALSAQMKSMSATDPYRLIDAMREEVGSHLEKGFGNRFGPLTPRITQGVVAGLIGECPIDWRDDHS